MSPLRLKQMFTLLSHLFYAAHNGTHVSNEDKARLDDFIKELNELKGKLTW